MKFLFIKPLKPREALLSIKESDDDESGEEIEKEKTKTFIHI